MACGGSIGDCCGQHDASVGARRASECWRKARRRLRAGPVYRWRYSGRTPERVLIAPPDLRLADPQIALEIYHGRFPLSRPSGRDRRPVAVPDRASPIAAGRSRCTASAGCATCAPPAPTLPPPMPARWCPTGSPRMAAAFPASPGSPAMTAQRIIAWLQHSSVVLQGAEFPFYRAFLKSLAVQIRYLRSMAPRDAGRRGAAAGAHRARLRGAVAAGAAVGAAQRHAPSRRGTRPPDPARWRPYLAQSDGGARTAGRPAAAAPDLCQPGRDAARRADRRGRAHAAGAALLPPPGRQPGALQRHGRDRSTTASPRSCATTTPAARRCCMRRIPATSGCRWAARP